MSPARLAPPWLGPALVALALAAGCEREERRLRELAPSSQRTVGRRLIELTPGLPPQGAPSWPGPYDENAYAISEGQKLYMAFNCVGCHAHGGGGMGPPLMDEFWIYGSAPENIFATIVEGRPNGMPSFGGKLPDYQVWQLVAFVRSMSGLVPLDAMPGRSDAMQDRKWGPVAPEESPTPGQR